MKENDRCKAFSTHGRGMHKIFRMEYAKKRNQFKNSGVAVRNIETI
jgi:hypothetical protein